jgi:hypothetical protein
VAGQRRSGRCRWHGFPPASPRAAGPSSLRNALATKSQSCPGSGDGGGGGSGCGRKGRQGFLVASPLRAAVFPRCGRRRHRRLGLFPTPFRATGPLFLQDPFTSGNGTSKRGHGGAEL